jgi:hypothetical protein
VERRRGDRNLELPELRTRSSPSRFWSATAVALPPHQRAADVPSSCARYGRHRRCGGVGNEVRPSRRRAEGKAADPLTIFMGFTVTATCSVLWPRG